jgi:hypothetical protein
VGQPAARGEQKLRDGDSIELKYRGNTAKLPVAIVPGHPDGAVTAFFGYGAAVTGRVGTSADETSQEFERLSPAHLRRAVVRQRARDLEGRHAT